MSTDLDMKRVDMKRAALEDRLRELRSVVVAFSAGLDSTLLLRVAVLTLGPDRVLAVTGRSASVPKAELDSAAALAAECGAPHEFLDTHEFDNPQYRVNSPDRCYFCKTELYARLLPLAAARGYAAVVSGTNADDLSDYRPGLRAASERGVRAPLAEAGLTKADVRALAAELGRALGFRYVTVDLRGFRSGSLNEVLLGAGLAGRVSAPEVR